MTRANSAWHPQQQTADSSLPLALHSSPAAAGAASPEPAPGDAAAFGPIVDENGVMTDGAGVPTGMPLSNPPLIEAISEDPILR
jgi:isoamylase